MALRRLLRPARDLPRVSPGLSPSAAAPSRRSCPARPAPLPAASQLRAPGAGKKPHAPARNAGLPGGRGAGRTEAPRREGG